MLNMTQEELAIKLGITKQGYSNKERGINEFSDKEKIIFKELLQPLFPTVTIDDIFF